MDLLNLLASHAPLDVLALFGHSVAALGLLLIVVSLVYASGGKTRRY